MKKWFAFGFSILFVALIFGMIWDTSANHTPHSRPSTNAKAPNFSLPNLDGQTIQLTDFDGQIRIVDFWATWCPPCKAEIPHFNALTEKYPNVAIIGISLDQGGPQVVEKFAKEFGVKYPLLMGNRETVEAYGDIRSIPTTFVIDQQGNIVNKHVGYRSQEVFEKEILALQTQY